VSRQRPHGRETRRPPKLVVEFELERRHGRVILVAETYEDELRLRSWLRRSAVFAALPAIAQWLLDDLDRIDESAA
jgi:hypothetical protein